MCLRKQWDEIHTHTGTRDGKQNKRKKKSRRIVNERGVFTIHTYTHTYNGYYYWILYTRASHLFQFTMYSFGFSSSKYCVNIKFSFFFCLFILLLLLYVLLIHIFVLFCFVYKVSISFGMFFLTFFSFVHLS